MVPGTREMILTAGGVGNGKPIALKKEKSKLLF